MKLRLKKGAIEVKKLIGWTIVISVLVIVLFFVGWLVGQTFPELLEKIINMLRGIKG